MRYSNTTLIARPYWPKLRPPLLQQKFRSPGYAVAAAPIARHGHTPCGWICSAPGWEYAQMPQMRKSLLPYTAALKPYGTRILMNTIHISRHFSDCPWRKLLLKRSGIWMEKDCGNVFFWRYEAGLRR